MEGHQGGRSAYQTFDKGRCKSLCISRICFKKKREREREREREIEREIEREKEERKKERERDR